MFGSLDGEQRRVLLALVRQVTIGAVAVTLGVLDGVAGLEGQDVAFEVRHGDQVLSGSLQDYFIAEVEAG